MANKPKTLQLDGGGRRALEAKSAEGRMSALEAALAYAESCDAGYTLRVTFTDGTEGEYAVLAWGPGWAAVRLWDDDEEEVPEDAHEIFIDDRHVAAAGVIW